MMRTCGNFLITLILVMSLLTVGQLNFPASVQSAETKQAKSVNKKSPSAQSKSSSHSSKKKTTKPRKKRKKPAKLDELVKMKWDMQRVAENKLPSGWYSKSGKWVITKEPEHPANKVLRQVQLKKAVQQLTVKGKYANFNMSVKLRADSFKRKTKNWQMGVMFRQVDSNNYYKCRITAANIALVRYATTNQDILPSSGSNTRAAGATGKRAGRDEQVLLILPIGSTADRWHTLQVDCYGDRIRLTLNGREVRSVNDVGLGAGKISIYTYKTQAFIDDIKLKFYPLPQSSSKVLPLKPSYSVKKSDGLLIYYQIDQPGQAAMAVFNPYGKLFVSLFSGYHTAGLHSVVWYGQGTLGKQPIPGRYTIKLKSNKDVQRATVRIR